MGLTRSIQDTEYSIDFVQGRPGSRRERVKGTIWDSFLSDPFILVTFKCIISLLSFWMFTLVQWTTEVCLFHVYITQISLGTDRSIWYPDLSTVSFSILSM